MRSRTFMTTAACAAVLALAACSSGSSTATASGQDPSPTAGDVTAGDVSAHSPLDCSDTLSVSQALATQVPKAAKNYGITLMMVTLSGYYYQAVAYGATEAAKAAGVTLHIVGGTGSAGFVSPADQLTEAQNALSSGTNAIVLEPADPNGSVSIVNDAAQRSVPVIAVGSMVNSSKAYQVQQDDYLQGKEAADQVAAALPKGGQGIVMAGPADATWANRRAAGFADEIKKYPNITVDDVISSDVDPSEGLTKFEAAVVQHPDIQWIYADYNLLLLPTSLPAQYKGKVKYFTGGLDPTTASALKSGVAQGVIVDWPIVMGRLGVAEAVEKLDGKTPPALTCLPAPTVTASTASSAVAKAQLYPAGFTASDS